MRAAAIACALLAGCASGPRPPETIRVPVAVPCVQELPAEAVARSDTELLALDDRALVLALAEDRERLRASYGELRAVLEACRDVEPVGAP